MLVIFTAKAVMCLMTNHFKHFQWKFAKMMSDKTVKHWEIMLSALSVVTLKGQLPSN